MTAFVYQTKDGVMAQFFGHFSTLAFVFLFAGQAAAADILQVAPIPRPQSGPISAKLAQSLSAWDRAQSDEAKECAAQVQRRRVEDKNPAWQAEFDLSYEVLLDTKQVFSLARKLYAACAGAYPRTEKTALVFDAATGQRYNPMQLYAIGKAAAYGYVFLPQIRAMVRKELLAQTKEAGCQQVLKEDEMAQFTADMVALDKNGLRILYTGSHATQACYVPVILPYPDLQPYLNKQEAKRMHWLR